MREITIPEIINSLNSRPCFYQETIEARILNGRAEVNLSTPFTKLIKEAARCSFYSSDIIYDIEGINDRIEHFNLDNEDNYSPILIAFRKMGVDGNNFVLSRTRECSQNLKYSVAFPPDYFSIFVFEFRKDEKYSDLGYVNIVIRAYYI